MRKNSISAQINEYCRYCNDTSIQNLTVFDMKIHNRDVHVYEIVVLPAPLYKPHQGVLFVKPVYNLRVIHRQLRYITKSTSLQHTQY